MQVRSLPESPSEGLPPARYPVSKTGGRQRLGGSTPSPSAWRHGRARQGSALLARRRATARRFESCCLRSNRSGVVEWKTRGCYPRSAGSTPAAGAPCAPVVEVAMTPGPQPGSCGFESRRGSFNWLWGSRPPRRFREPEIAGSTPAGQIPLRISAQRGRGAAVLASLMSSRSWVRIPPAPCRGT